MPQKQNEPSPFDDGALYDVLFKDFKYGLDFYLGQAREAKGPVLEIACGTGRIMLPCLQAGVDIEGLDVAQGMLDALKGKATPLGLSPTLHLANMNDFQLSRRFALIMITFNSFVHNLSTEDQITTLRLCRDHLLPGGLLVFDTFFPAAAIITAPEGARDLEAEVKHPLTGLPVRLFDTRSFNRVEQIQRSHNEIEELDARGRVVAVHHSYSAVRWIYKSEMELLLRVAGFGRWQICGDFDLRPLVNETDAMIVLAWNE